MKVTITQEIKIAFNGIDVEHFLEGQIVEGLDEKKIARLQYYDACEVINEPSQKKVVEVETKEKPKKRGKDTK